VKEEEIGWKTHNKTMGMLMRRRKGVKRERKTVSLKKTIKGRNENLFPGCYSKIPLAQEDG